MNIAKMIVRRAVSGIKENKRCRELPGLISKDLYDLVSLHRKNNSLAKNNAKTGYAGFADLDTKIVKERSLAGVVKSGRIPKKDGEWELCYYLHDKGMKWKDVACFVNNRMHDGENIRTSHAVRIMAGKYKNQ